MILLTYSKIKSINLTVWIFLGILEHFEVRILRFSEVWEVSLKKVVMPSLYALQRFNGYDMAEMAAHRLLDYWALAAACANVKKNCLFGPSRQKIMTIFPNQWEKDIT